MNAREPTLSELIIGAIQSRLLDFHVMLPCKVIAYNKDEGTVDVELLLRDQRPQLDGTIVLKDFPPIKDVPVRWFRCGKAWITLPLAVGDLGHVVFADRNLSNWSASQKGTIVDPKDLGMHNLSGAVFEPGLNPASSPVPSPDGDNMVLHSDTELHLGEKGLDANQYVALSKKVLDELDKIRTAVHNHAHTVVLGACTAGGATGTATTSSAPSVPALTEPKAAKVKAK